MEIDNAGIYVDRFFICGGGKSVNIACVYKDTEKRDFIIDIDFLCEVRNMLHIRNTYTTIHIYMRKQNQL